MALVSNDSQELLSCEKNRAIVATGGVLRRAAFPIAALAVGLASGSVAHSFTTQGRLRPPLQAYASLQELKYSANMSALEGKTTSIVNSAIQVAAGGWCGMPSPGYSTYVRCAEAGICCLGTKGNLCGAHGGYCAHGEAGVVVCAAGARGCLNDVGAAYCCAEGNTCSQNVCLASPGQCFPGEASATVKDVGAVPLHSLRSGDRVLVKNGDYEPVLGFLHVTGANEISNFLSVRHSNGQLRVSPHHVVFVDSGDKLAADLIAGDKLLVAEKSSVAAREVLSVTQSSGRSGMFAPMTPSGTVVVDSVVASNYASYGHVPFPHCALHGVFFPVRAFHALGLASLLRSSVPAGTTESLHPYAASIWNLVGPIATKVF